LVEISDNQMRCDDCGHGSTFARLVASGAPGSSAEQQARIDRLLGQMEQRDRLFAGAPFPVYGLDARWTGLRSFGGWGNSNGVTTSLSLAFGDVGDQEAAQLRVETQRPEVVALDGTRNPMTDRSVVAHSLVMHLAHGVELPDDVRAIAFPARNPNAFVADATAAWTDTLIAVEGVATPAKMLAVGDVWIAIVSVGDLTVGITARGWPVADVGLVVVTDFHAYADGSTEIRDRLRRRHPDPD
jgi:hypothetical protein